jgi:MFS transporter, DHA1 family, inner membrane transport protein
VAAPGVSVSNWPAIWAIFVSGLAASAYMTKVPPALPLLREELGLTLVQGSFVATTFNIVGMFTGMLAGVVCDRFGYKRLVLAGMGILAGGGALGAVSQNFELLLLSRCLEGAGFILCVVSAPTLLTAVTANVRDRVRALSLWSAYMPTGGSLALLAAPAVIALGGWRGLWTVLALCAAAGALLFARVVPATPPSGVRSLRLVAESLAQRGNIAMALLFAFYVAQWTSVLTWLPTFLVERGLSTATAAIAAAMMVVANIPGTLAAGALLSRGVSRGRLIVAASLLTAACEVGMFAEALPASARYGLVIAFSMAGGLIPASVFSGLPVHAPSAQHIATGNGMALQTSNLGQFLGPFAIAWAASRFGGWDASLWVLLMFAAGAAACGLAIGRIESRMAAGARIRP